MCGIAGIISLNNKREFKADEVISLSQTLKHRGPDDEGFLFISDENAIIAGGESTPENVLNSSFSYCPKLKITDNRFQISDFRLALIHRRLSIIDTSPAGHQPMSTQDENCWIIFNGEIYNFPEIKSDLISRGYKFLTHTDTEVLLHSYKEWGFDCVQHFNGMWSFVIYDKLKNIVFGSRDRTGVKPFYYFKNKNVFSFASELKALIKLPFYQKKINPKAVFDFFVFNRIERMEESFFMEIFELFPAHSFSINLQNGEFKKWKYYSLKANHDFEKFNGKKFEDFSGEIKNLIIDSVKIRLRSDVSVGSCLSGGIDSSTIVCIINDLLKAGGGTNILQTIGERQKVFTSSFLDSAIDESKWAKIVVDKTNAQWHQTFPEINKLLLEIENLVYCQDIPFISTSSYGEFCVMQMAQAKNVKVLLNGQGGDELFSGYPYHPFGFWLELLSHLKFFQLSKEMKFHNKADSLFLKNFMKYIVLPRMPKAILNIAYPVYFNELKYLNPDFISENKEQYKNNSDIMACSLNSMLENEYFSGPLKNLLKYADRNSMHFSIEARTPFADDINLWEKAFSIPSQYKIHLGESKALLRHSMKGIIPDEIRNRKDKMGFVTPNNQWISELKDGVRHYVEEDDSGIFNKNLFLKEYDSFFNQSSARENYRIFKFLSFSMWKKTFGM